MIHTSICNFVFNFTYIMKKHQLEYRHQWSKLHICIDTETLQIRAVQLTTNNISDSQVLDDLLGQIPLDERIDSVYTNGACDTKNAVKSLRLDKHMQSFRQENIKLYGLCREINY